MELLGVPPGRVVGEALAFLLEIRLDEGLLGDEAIRNACSTGTPRCEDCAWSVRPARGRPKTVPDGCSLADSLAHVRSPNGAGCDRYRRGRA